MSHQTGEGRAPNSSAVALLLTLVAGGCGSTATTQVESEADLQEVQKLLPGRYLGQGRSGPVFHSITRVNVPELGGDVFYHHVSTASFGGPSVQRKYYRFESGGRSMRSTVLIQPGVAMGAPGELKQSLGSLPEEALLKFPPGCVFEWDRTDDGYVARLPDGECGYDSPAFGGPVMPQMTYQLGRCGLKISEAIFREDGSPVFPPSNIWSQRQGVDSDGCPG